MQDKVIQVRELFREPEAFHNKKIVISGWVRTVRAQKNFGFIELNDGSQFENIQIVFEDKLENFQDVAKLTIGSAIQISGTFVPTPDAKQAFEINADVLMRRLNR